jgi:hypothetical protein
MLARKQPFLLTGSISRSVLKELYEQLTNKVKMDHGDKKAGTMMATTYLRKMKTVAGLLTPTTRPRP